jgi:hypothetical protein
MGSDSRYPLDSKQPLEDPKLPPYSEHAPPTGDSSSDGQLAVSRIAGNIQTCSIKDNQTDYLKIVRDSATGYHVCLTVDPRPLYRIQVVEGPTKTGNIQVFAADESTLPIAAVRLNPELNPKKKSDPLATICTNKPYLPEAKWLPFVRAGALSVSEDYLSSIPIVGVPGTPPTDRQFGWRTYLCDPFFELWWEGPLVNVSTWGYRKDERDSRYLFATVVRRKDETGQNVIEIRRGGGLEFELSVVLQMFVILRHKNKQLF